MRRKELRRSGSSDPDDTRTLREGLKTLAYPSLVAANSVRRKP